MNLSTIRTALQGKKTYIVAGLTVLIGLSQYFGIDVPACGQVDPISVILQGFGFATLRATLSR